MSKSVTSICMKWLLKKWCSFRDHPNSYILSGPFNGYWTRYCPDCNEHWDEIVDGVMPRPGKDD